MNNPINIGISACLLGQKVRWNKTHKLDPYLTQTLGQFIHYVPVCPETEAGFGVPREPMRLIGDPRRPRLMTFNNQTDLTSRMLKYTQKRLQILEKKSLCGFIFKSRSPSCGRTRVKVYNDRNKIENKGIGIFACQFMDYFPLIPTEDDGRLHNPSIIENFIERIFTLKRWRELLTKKKHINGLVDFHTRNKLLILSHSSRHAGHMGKLVAAGKSLSPKELFARYETLLMEALSLKTTVKKNLNVFHHLLGYFKKQLTVDEKRELLEISDAYRDGFVPLVVPITLINHYVRKYDQPYLKLQTYLNPHPVELKLRTHV